MSDQGETHDVDKQGIEINVTEMPVVETAPKWLLGLCAVAFTVLVGIAIEGYFNSSNAEERGQWGDFFGGTLNPILTFLTVVGLLYTIILQRSELRLSRQELILTREELKSSTTALEAQNVSMQQQRFESTLFSMIGVLNQIVDQMDIEVGTENQVKKHVSGRDCFSEFFVKLKNAYQDRPWNAEPVWTQPTNIGKNKGEAIDYLHDNDRIFEAYTHVYADHAPDLGHYFRVLYNIFSFISVSEYKNSIYQKILRAQLSNQELLIIYYNCACPIGEKFKALAKEFALFDNMDTQRLIRAGHKDLLPTEAFGSNPMVLPDE